jgi:hypothetical protein
MVRKTWSKKNSDPQMPCWCDNMPKQQGKMGKGTFCKKLKRVEEMDWENIFLGI